MSAMVGLAAINYMSKLDRKNIRHTRMQTDEKLVRNEASQT